MKTLIIGDTHGNWKVMRRLMEDAGAFIDGRKADGWTIGHIGDLLNLAPMGSDFRGFVSDDAGTLEFALEHLDWCLVGNHEAWWTHNVGIAGEWVGMARAASQLEPGLVDAINRAVDAGWYRCAAQVGTAVCTHGGITQSLWRHLMRMDAGTVWGDIAHRWDYENRRTDGWDTGWRIQSAVVNALNDALMDRRMNGRMDERRPEIDWVGKASGWMDPTGGVLWARPVEFSAGNGWDPPFRQIAGHTVDRIHPRWYQGSDIWFIDGGGYKETPAWLGGVVYDHDLERWTAVRTAGH